MENTYWHKQTNGSPLFPDLIWSKPETKRRAGKLLILGGNLHGFAAPAEAYHASIKAGIGTARVLMPEALRKIVGGHFEVADFAASTPSGSFAKNALAKVLDEAAWADAVLVAGDLGRNSETAILLDSFIQKYSGPVCLAQDTVDYVVQDPHPTIVRLNTLIVANLGQLQKLLQESGYPEPVTFGMGMVKLADVLHGFTTMYPVALITKHNSDLVAAHGGLVSTTHTNLKDDDFWRVSTAAQASVWWLQNPTKVFEALTSSVVVE